MLGDHFRFVVWKPEVIPNGVLVEERPTRPMEKVFAWLPCRFVRSGQRATITGIRNGGGFPNRRSKFLGELSLILKDLFSRRARFRSYSAPKTHQGNFRICAKLLKANRGEVAERLNAAVC